MKVNIQKDGKKKAFNLINSWSDVTLDKWAKLVGAHSENRTKSQEALDTISNLSDIPEIEK